MIGSLALPWLLLMIHLVSPDLFTSNRKHAVGRLLSLVPIELRSPLIGIAAFTFAYLAGSAILPVAGEFLNDKELIGRVLPTEGRIQEQVYRSMTRKPSVLLASTGIGLVSFASQTPGDRLPGGSHEDFLMRESALLLRGTDANERLNRLHERLAVLRGATFNSFVLLLVCVFAWCAAANGSKSRIARWAAFLPAGSLVLLAISFGIWDIYMANIEDMPIMEAVLLLLGLYGLYVAARGTRCNVRLHAWTFLFAMFFMVLSYGGYACTEVSYDEDVYTSSYQALRTAAPAAVSAAVRGDAVE
jgi:hypothetical protein